MENIVGIRTETIDSTECRAPLTPKQVKTLIDQHRIDVLVEPSGSRIFKENEYEQAGARVNSDLSGCNIIFGLKEVPIPDIIPGKPYCIFSHTAKGQRHNMPMLKRFIDAGDTLLDYEFVRNDEGRRIIAFGEFAGYAGMIDSLWVLGKRLRSIGIENPFEEIRQANYYYSLAEAESAIREIGKRIQEEGLPSQIVPFLCGFTGYGKVANAAQYIFDLLPVVNILPDALPSFFDSGKFSNNVVYPIAFKKAHLYERSASEAGFDLQEFNSHPERYQSRFEKFVPYLTMIIHGIYWEPRFPRLLTKRFLKSLYSPSSQPRLQVIGDITCDIEGSIEVTVKATNSKNPVYVYEPSTDRPVDGWEGHGPVVLAVDKLPTELPVESSNAFGETLLPFVPSLVAADYNVPREELTIPLEFIKAVIVHQGTLTSDFQYLAAHIHET